MRSAYRILILTLTVAAYLFSGTPAISDSTTLYWMKVKAHDKFERSIIADLGAAIDFVGDDYVVVVGNREIKEKLESLGRVEVSFNLTQKMLEYPKGDEPFHTYFEVARALETLALNNPDFVTVKSIGRTYEGRDILALRITTEQSKADQKPAVIFMGGHHAREHVSVEIPLRFAQYLVDEYNKGNQRIVDLIESRDIHIIPVVNPDGKEYDISGNSYAHWRKNRRNNGRDYGVDLNRNYSYKWGTGGSSKSSNSDTYMGPQPFSEPETIAIRDYVEAHENISILLSFHTFSELILYPWGHTYDPIQDSTAQQVHETMAKEMAKWNGYKPQQSSDLYIASGDTTDWSFGEHKIISFTFELDPKDQFTGGFYPGASKIQGILQKNIEPCLYLLSYADNPYRVIGKTKGTWFFSRGAAQHESDLF